MPDILIGLLISCALRFGIGYGIREHMSRQRHRRHPGETVIKNVPFTARAAAGAFGFFTLT